MFAFILSNIFILNSNVTYGQCTDGCGEISALDCADIVVGLPYRAYFTGNETGMQDASGEQTGFTMVQAHSESRLTEDGSPTCPAIIGYEPSKLAIIDNNLNLTAGRGIAFLDPPASSRNNTQINTLGVGLQVNNQRFDVQTTINTVNTGTNSAQAGLWYGLDEDNFVKFVVVNNNNLELRVESGGVSTPLMVTTLSSLGLQNNDVTLKLSFDFTGVTKTVTGSYQIGTGSEVTLPTTLEVPASFGTGVSLATGIDEVSFAGIFATYRNGSEYTAIFDDFLVTDPTFEDLFFSLEVQNETLQQNTNSTFSLSLTTSDASIQNVTLSAEVDGAVPTWLTVGGNVLDGTVIHNTTEPEIVFQMDATGLAAGNYTALVRASAAGFNDAFFFLSLVVNELGGEALANFSVNFMDAVTFVPPTDFLADYGEPYGPKSGTHQGIGMTYGWISQNNKTPLSLEDKVRNRNTPADLESATFIHMQNGTESEYGIWEAEVPNGTYEVTVSVGDGGPFVDSEHGIKVEGVVVIAPFTPAPREIRVGTATIGVTDGKLTMDAIGGSNTKANYIIIQPAPGAQRPFVVGTNVSDGDTDVELNVSISTQALSLPNGGLENSTVIADNVILRSVVDGQIVPANINATGGGDAITLVPTQTLEPNTLYQFDITDGVLDSNGEPLIPYSIQFVTGNGFGESQELLDVNFTQVDLGTDAQGMYTSLIIGPDGKLYATSVDGRIKRFNINPVDGTLTLDQEITPFGANPKLLISIEFDPSATADNLIAWISYSNTPTFNEESNAPDWDGVIARLSGPNLESFEEVVINLPRSLRDHVVIV